MSGAADLDFPPPPGVATARWTGTTFAVGGETRRILAYGSAPSGWTDHLTDLHEATAGADHFIDVASRAHAVSEVARVASRPGAVILEVGISSGFLLNEMIARLPQATFIGADYTLGTLEKAAQRLPADVPLLQFDLTECPLPSASVDAAVLLNVLEHIEHDTTALAQLHRILKPGGAVIIEVPAGEGLYDRYDKALLHWRRYGMSTLVRRVKDAGFQDRAPVASRVLSVSGVLRGQEVRARAGDAGAGAGRERRAIDQLVAAAGRRGIGVVGARGARAVGRLSPLRHPVPGDRQKDRMIANRVFITGGAGFIGSSAADHFLASGAEVVVYDNFSTGRRDFLTRAIGHPRFTLVEGDTADLAAMTAAMRGADLVLHFAANADVRFGTEHPRKDLEQNTIATFNVLEAMRAAGVSRIGFSSTGSVYGEAAVIPTPEDAPFPVQTSLYGASKLAGEGLIAAYASGFGFSGCIFRFVSILGERYTHGHVFDFYKSLRRDPRRLRVLGNGRQRKSYLYIQDCLSAIDVALAATTTGVQVFNLGTDEYCEVNDSIGWICEHLGVRPAFEYTGGDRGWIGDNPFIFLDCAKVRALGWRPALSIREGVLRTLQYLQNSPELLEARS